MKKKWVCGVIALLFVVSSVSAEYIAGSVIQLSKRDISREEFNHAYFEEAEGRLESNLSGRYRRQPGLSKDVFNAIDRELACWDVRVGDVFRFVCETLYDSGYCVILRITNVERNGKPNYDWYAWYAWK